jgi:GNAT superfamily N-acetyltransferase
MRIDDFIVIRASEQADQLEISDEIVELVWPEFMLHDTVGNKYWQSLYEKFSKFQFIIIERKSKKIAGTANCVPLFWNKDPGHLPDEGWDWALQHAFADLEAGIEPNCLCALSITVAPDFQGKGISKELVGVMKAIAAEHRFKNLLAPVRPNFKCKYPLTHFTSYIKWKNEQGSSFDPWIRVHEKLGGHVIKACPKSMEITGSVQEWQRWTKMSFPESGDYIIPGALNPVNIDLKSDQGIYIEENLWIVHQIED